MAKIMGGILGEARGSVASVTAQKWKGINFIRQKPTPKNPRTMLQMAQRSNIRLNGRWAKKLLPLFGNPILNRFLPRISAFNQLQRWNVLNWAGIASGREVPPSNVTAFSANYAAYSPADNRFVVSRGTLPNLDTFQARTYPARLVYQPLIYFNPRGNNGLLPTDYFLLMISDLEGILPTITQMFPIDSYQTDSVGRYFEFSRDWESVINYRRMGNRAVLSGNTIRFLHPETREIPIEISNSFSYVLDLDRFR